MSLSLIPSPKSLQPGLEELTERQMNVFVLAVESIEVNGRPITYRELAAQLEVCSTNGVRDFIIALIRKGWVRPREPGPVHRFCIQPTEAALTELLGPRCKHCVNGRVSK